MLDLVSLSGWREGLFLIHRHAVTTVLLGKIIIIRCFLIMLLRTYNKGLLSSPVEPDSKISHCP